MLLVSSMCASMIDEYGTSEQRERWIPALASMEKMASYCLTEPGTRTDNCFAAFLIISLFLYCLQATLRCRYLTYIVTFTCSINGSWNQQQSLSQQFLHI